MTTVTNKHLNKSNSPPHAIQFSFCENHSTEFANCLFIEKK